VKIINREIIFMHKYLTKIVVVVLIFEFFAFPAHSSPRLNEVSSPKGVHTFIVNQQKQTYRLLSQVSDIKIFIGQSASLSNASAKNAFTTDQKKLINKLVAKAITLNQSEIDISAMNILIHSTQEHSDGNKHFTLIADNDSTLVINFSQLPKTNVEQALFFQQFSHQVHHVNRLRAFNELDNSLLEFIVSEGLAVHYAQAITGTNQSEKASALDHLNHQQQKNIYQQAKKELHSTSYNKNTWLLGKGNYPKDTAVAIGYKMVLQYMKNYIGTDAKNLSRIHASQFANYLLNVSPSSKKSRVFLRTPDLVKDEWDQVPVSEFERQALLAPANYFIEGYQHNKLVALSFDDGPSPYTQGVLEVLKNYNIKATFFMMGLNVKKHPKMAEQVFQQGHTVANHSWDHSDSKKYTDSDKLWHEQINKTNHLFKEMFGFTSRLFRPPYGKITDKQVQYLADKGVKTIQWSIDTRDWNEAIATENFVYVQATNTAHEEAVILMHDAGGNRENTVKALPKIIEQYQALGYSFVTIDQLYGFSDKF
jgi:peptidoglycan/xylan/chitin deacetylase (PgdA/CDA1 family)